MGVLTELPSYRICTDKGRFDINPAFDIILEVQRLYKEESLTDYEKIKQALSMLVRNRWNLRLLNPAEQLKLMQDITSRYIEVEKRPQIKRSPVPVLDFERDGDYIYASFMQAYRIDLIDEQGKYPGKSSCICSMDCQWIQKSNRLCGSGRCRFRNTMARIQKRYRKSMR